MGCQKLQPLLSSFFRPYPADTAFGDLLSACAESRQRHTQGGCPLREDNGPKAGPCPQGGPSLRIPLFTGEPDTAAREIPFRRTRLSTRAPLFYMSSGQERRKITAKGIVKKYSKSRTGTSVRDFPRLKRQGDLTNAASCGTLLSTYDGNCL